MPGQGRALEDLLGTGLVTLTEPEGSPQAFQSIDSPGCLPSRGRPAEQTGQRGMGGGTLRRLFAEAGRGAEGSGGEEAGCWGPRSPWRQEAGPAPRRVWARGLVLSN